MILRVILPFLLAIQSAIGLPTIDNSTYPDDLSPLASNDVHSGWTELPEGQDDDLPRSSRSLAKRHSAKGRVIDQTNPDLSALLRFASQPKGSDIENVIGFQYLDYAGADVTVYMHDTGLYVDHPEFKGKREKGVKKPNVQVILPKKTLKGEGFPQVQGDPDGHGTCASSLVIGRLYGIAKGASLKMVPFGDIRNDDYMLTGLQAIVDDIKRKKKQKGSKGFFPVVNLSYTIGTARRKNANKDVFAKYRQLYLDMVNEGALLIAPVSNVDETFTTTSVNQYPARYAEEDDFKDSMIITGGVDMYGKKWKHSQDGPLIQGWAPAIAMDNTPKGDMSWKDDNWQGISCAGLGKPDLDIQDRGTSYTAPPYAGLAAYFYSSYSNLRGVGAARKVKNKILSANYARADGGPDCLWNLRQGQLACG
ncbi:subtilisin-like protease [Penicillium capsulatum]|uniref:Subtilisin-like protease n=1 Tax=Penicillium capsulatum TaxID=69766 RepID=A0A9W9ISR8_9EURO|nr:subtilisin-like protease [Penicillium capsulatum]KAJ6129963.1 subtilisin-like protease [Penicillium capsulatum]